MIENEKEIKSNYKQNIKVNSESIHERLPQSKLENGTFICSHGNIGRSFKYVELTDEKALF